MTIPFRIAVSCCMALALLSSCGGGGGTGSTPHPPGAPTSLAVDAGDSAVSLAWVAPASDGGAAVTGYAIDIAPAAAQATISRSGTTAVVGGLSAGTNYTFSVAASNSAGRGLSSNSVQATPAAADTNAYVPIAIPGDPNAASGVFDPSIVDSASGTAWLAYSSVHYYDNGAAQLVQDVSTSIARSLDGGRTFNYVQTVGAAHGPVTVTDASGTVCGAATCSGRWIYEVPFMVEDAGDPNPARRFKLFAHKYFLYPPATPATEHVLGAIVMWTAAAPDSTWSAESTALRWGGTPPEIVGGTRLDSIDAALAPCLLVTEGSAALHGGALDLAFSCLYASGGGFVGKVVLLRSADHAATLSYVATLLAPADAAIFPGAGFLNAPALLASGSGPPLLLVTPDNGTGTYLGCVVVPFASEAAGTLVRTAAGLPAAILTLRTPGGRFGGACSWDRGLRATGILIDDLDTSATPPFRIQATHKAP